MSDQLEKFMHDACFTDYAKAAELLLNGNVMLRNKCGDQEREVNRLRQENKILRDGIAEIIGQYDNYALNKYEMRDALCELQAKVKGAMAP